MANQKLDEAAQFDQEYMDWLSGDEGGESDNDKIHQGREFTGFTGDSTFFGTSSGQCPADLQVQTAFGTLSLSFKWLCDLALGIKAVFLMIGLWFGVREFMDWVK